MDNFSINGRRGFLYLTTSVGASLLLSECTRSTPSTPEGEKGSNPKNEEEVSPAEDLMREHGVLARVLLIYEEALRRIDSQQDIDPAALAGSAGIVRRFIEDYHEKLEEDYLFPRFQKAGSLLDLVTILREQHKTGRRITEEIEHLSTEASLKNPEDRRKVVVAIQRFIRMYRPHAAREDTVLFPAFRHIVTPNEYDSLGEQFEDQEHKLFGEDGFEKIVNEVVGLEKRMGIDNLVQFTPAL